MDLCKMRAILLTTYSFLAKLCNHIFFAKNIITQ